MLKYSWFPPSYLHSDKSLFQSTDGAGLGWQRSPGVLLSPACGGVLQADPWLSFRCAEHGQMTVLVRVKYCEGFVITFPVFWAPYWLPAFAHASPNSFTVYHEQLVPFLQSDTAAYQCHWD